jgi:hypothetical protein
MRVAVIVIGIAMVSTPSYASKSCMSLAEARQQLGQVHLYWHGSGHCWDAMAGRHGFVRHARRSEVRQAERDNDDEKLDAADAADQSAKKPKWRDAMSEMLPVDAPVFRSAAAAIPATAAIPVTAAIPISEPSDAPAPGPNWLDRWVEIVQVFPRINASGAAGPVAPQPTRFEPLVTPVRVILAFLAIALTLAVIEILFRSTIHEYRK